MQVETELSDMFSYSFLPIIIFIIVLLGLIIIFKLYKPHKAKEKVVLKPNTLSHNDTLNIKKKYLLQLDNLVKEVNDNSINVRKAYQKLSKLIRNYIFETTGIKVQNYTLSEIEKVNMPSLYELVKEFYNPEFSISSSGNILESISKTRVVIEKWK